MLKSIVFFNVLRHAWPGLLSLIINSCRTPLGAIRCNPIAQSGRTVRGRRWGDRGRRRGDYGRRGCPHGREGAHRGRHPRGAGSARGHSKKLLGVGDATGGAGGATMGAGGAPTGARGRTGDAIPEVQAPRGAAARNYLAPEMRPRAPEMRPGAPEGRLWDVGRKWMAVLGLH
eukprot:gene16425-biopygen7591